VSALADIQISVKDMPDVDRKAKCALPIILSAVEHPEYPGIHGTCIAVRHGRHVAFITAAHVLGPRRTGEIRPTADGSKPANGRDPRPVRFYPAVASECNCRVRQLRGPHLSTWAWWRSRSSIAVTAATSPSAFPQSSTGRFEVMTVEARS